MGEFDAGEEEQKESLKENFRESGRKGRTIETWQPLMRPQNRVERHCVK